MFLQKFEMAQQICIGEAFVVLDSSIHVVMSCLLQCCKYGKCK